MELLKSTSKLSFVKKISSRVLALLFFFSLSQSNLFAQAGCCVGINFDGGSPLSYCIANMDPCTVGSTCTTAALDAAYGITGNWPAGTQCNTPADCSTQNCGALPVELFGFEINLVHNGIELIWNTASEINNEGFIIENSINGRDWSEVFFVKGNGTSLEPHGYSWLDENPAKGFNYYRLKQVDYDGAFEYSEMKVTIWQGSNDFSQLQLAVLPNPASEWITVALPSEMTIKERVEFNIFDQLGRQVRQFIKGQNDEIRISLDGLPKGYYILNARQGRYSSSTSFIKR